MTTESNEDYLDSLHFLGEDGKPLPKRQSQWVEWISVKDRLPEPYEYCLVFAKRGVNEEPSTISIARQYKGIWEMLNYSNESNAVACGDLTWFMREDEITHWMPFPKPPEE